MKRESRHLLLDLLLVLALLLALVALFWLTGAFRGPGLG